MTDADTIQLLAQGRDALGHPIVMRPYEKLLKLIITDDEVKVLFQTYSYTEKTTRIVFTKRGKRLTIYPRFGQRRNRPDTEIIWEDDYPGEEIVKFGRVYEGREWHDRRTFEADCYRPGTSRNPLDNAERVAAGATAPKMEGYWK